MRPVGEGLGRWAESNKGWAKGRGGSARVFRARPGDDNTTLPVSARHPPWADTGPSPHMNRARRAAASPRMNRARRPPLT